MSIFVDTGIFVAAVNVADRNHEAAKELMAGLMKGKFGPVYTSDYVIDEAITASLARIKKLGPVIKLGEFILRSPRIRKLRVTGDVFDAAWERFKSLGKRPMSFTDCTSLALMEMRGMESIASFDSGFDGFVERVG